MVYGRKTMIVMVMSCDAAEWFETLYSIYPFVAYAEFILNDIIYWKMASTAVFASVFWSHTWQEWWLNRLSAVARSQNAGFESGRNQIVFKLFLIWCGFSEIRNLPLEPLGYFLNVAKSTNLRLELFRYS